MPTQRWPVRRVSQGVVISLPDEVDLSNALSIEQSLGALADEGALVVIADMTGTRFFASAGVSALIKANRRAGERGSRVRVACAVPQVLRVLELTAADQIIEVFATVDAALAAGVGSGEGLPAAT